MSIPSTSEALLFVLFLFVPGAICMMVYRLLVPGDRFDFSKKWQQALVCSLFFDSLVILLLSRYDEQYRLIIIFIGLFVLPVPVAIIWGWMRKWLFQEYGCLDPYASSWDYVFSRGRNYWVIATLKNGNKVAGVFTRESYASPYPFRSDLYLQQQWSVNEDGGFDNVVENTSGVWVSANEISVLEFFSMEAANDDTSSCKKDEVEEM